MRPPVMLALCLAFSFYAIYSDVRRSRKNSWGMWIVLAWFFISASKPVALWLNPGPVGAANAQEPGGPVNTATLLVLIAFGLIALFGRQEALRLVRFANWLVFLIFFLAFSTIWSEVPASTMTAFLRQFGHLVMILLIVTEDSPQEAIVSFLKRAAYILVPLSLVLITDFPHIGIRYSTWDGQPAYAGAMTGKNSLALFSQLMALFFVWKLVCSRWYKESPRLDLTILAMTLYLLKKADSDAQWVCFLVGAFLLLTSRYERLAPRLRKAVVFVAIACVVLVASEAILGINNTLVEYLKGNATFAGRVELWRILRSVAPNVLFGAGYQSFWTPGRMSIIAADFPWTPTQAHNGYLEMFLNAGMVGLVCLFGLIISTFRKIEKTIQHGEQLGILLTCFVLSFVLTNLTEASVGKMSIAWFLLLLTSVFAFMKEAAWRAANPVWRIPARDARPHPLKPVKNLVRQNI